MDSRRVRWKERHESLLQRRVTRHDRGASLFLGTHARMSSEAPPPLTAGHGGSLPAAGTGDVVEPAPAGHLQPVVHARAVEVVYSRLARIVQQFTVVLEILKTDGTVGDDRGEGSVAFIAWTVVSLIRFECTDGINL